MHHVKCRQSRDDLVCHNAAHSVLRRRISIRLSKLKRCKHECTIIVQVSRHLLFFMIAQQRSCPRASAHFQLCAAPAFRDA